MVWIVIAIIFTVLVVLLFALLFYIYRIMYFSPKKGQNDEMRAEPSLDYQGMRPKSIEFVKEILSLPYEELFIKSYDGLLLHGYFYRSNSSDDFVLMFNGYRGTPRRDFSGGALLMMKLKKNVILIDQRAHGQSKGHSICFGRKEQNDVVSWVDFVKKKWRKTVNIIVVGISMGGATVLMSSDKLPRNVRVIADCPYSREKDVIKYSMKKLGYPSTLMWPFAYLSAVIFCHARLKDDASENVKKSKCKILIIHGTGDTIVPHKMSERVYQENRDHVKYETFDGVEHALSYLREPERYEKVIKEFLNE